MPITILGDAVSKVFKSFKEEYKRAKVEEKKPMMEALKMAKEAASPIAKEQKERLKEAGIIGMFKRPEEVPPPAPEYGYETTYETPTYESPEEEVIVEKPSLIGTDIGEEEGVEEEVVVEKLSLIGTD